MTTIKITLIMLTVFVFFLCIASVRIYFNISDQKSWIQNYIDRKYYEDHPSDAEVPKYQARERVLGAELQGL